MSYDSLVGLCVEDEPLVLIEMSKVLSELGFGRTLTAHRLSLAFELIEATPVDFALLDYDLGYGERTTELGLALRDAGTPVLFASGYQRSDLDPRLADFPFIEKPAMTRALTRRIAELLDGKTKKGGPGGTRQ